MLITPRSVRSKMVMPAVAVVVATLVATVVMLILSAFASARLKQVEQRDLIALQFYVDLHASMQRLHLLLETVAGSGNSTNLDLADDLHSEMVERIAKEGAAVVGAAELAQMRAELGGYYDGARAFAARAAIAALAAKSTTKEGQNPNLWGPNAAERSDAAASSEIEDRFNALFSRFEEGSTRARAAMSQAFAEAARRQRGSIAAGAAILFAAAVLSFVMAWWMSGRTARPLHALSEVALRIAGGDLTQEVQVDSDDEVGVLAQSFRRMSARLREIVGTLKATSQELAIAAERLSDHTRAQSALLERQASGVAETSTTTRELEQTSSVAASRAASVLEVAKRAAEMSDQGRQSAERSAAELSRIQGSVDSIVGQSAQLLDQARQVGDIVETVRDLATQSHVLSLNASIEAARAGEAGKSFAVVAQEVRALAEQSGHSAARIAKMVQDILSAVQSTRETTEKGSAGMSGSLDQIRASGDSLRQIGAIVRETSDAALHIASAVQQQSTGIGQIAVAMRDLDKGMEETIGRIRSLELSAQQVAETATRISGIAAEFTV